MSTGHLTTTQPDLFSFSEHGLQAQFERFHQANPHVYRELVRLARRWRDAGHRKCGIKLLFEVLRWELGLRTTEEEPRLNNNWTSRYARLIEAQEPDLEGFFELRELKA